MDRVEGTEFGEKLRFEVLSFRLELDGISVIQLETALWE